MKLNSQGPEVVALQHSLNQIGSSAALPRQHTLLPYLEQDGVFGVKTHVRVVEFQRLNGLTANGIVDFGTSAVIGALLPAVRPTAGLASSAGGAGAESAGWRRRPGGSAAGNVAAKWSVAQGAAY